MPGAARQQVTLFCVAQNTSNQTKGHPAAPALRATFGLTVKLGGCATRPSMAHKPCPAAELEQCSPSSQFVRQTEAAQKGVWVLWARSRRFPPLPSPLPVGAREWCGGFVLVPSPSRGRSGWGAFFGPLGPPPSSTAGPGAVGEDCLRPRGPSSAAARFGEQRRAPRRGGGWGRLLWYTLSWRSKKGVQLPGCPGTQITPAKRTNLTPPTHSH